MARGWGEAGALTLFPFNKHFQATQAASTANGKFTALEKNILVSLNPPSWVTKRATQPCLLRDAASISPALLVQRSPQAIPVPGKAVLSAPCHPCTVASDQWWGWVALGEPWCDAVWGPTCAPHSWSQEGMWKLPRSPVREDRRLSVTASAPAAGEGTWM